jgi:dethiobiotin synthetase
MRNENIMRLIVAGIGTDIGKTVVSAILVKMLGADYWKPIGCGPKEQSDSNVIKSIIDNQGITIHPSAYHFAAPLSPHHAGALEDPPIQANRELIRIPDQERSIVIEMVGGIMVPLNNNETTLDLFLEWNLPLVIVSKNYLGSINHTLLTIDCLKQRKANILGIVFNGSENSYSESFILNYTQLPMIGRVQEEEEITPTVINRYSQEWAENQFWKEKMNSLRPVSC